jgi:hypothetical protein
LNWTKEPEQSFEELMDAHAILLRNKYERLILSWSGGTDSQTIYNVFKRNKIHIDEILFRIEGWQFSTVDGKLLYDPNKHVNWLKENHWDPTTVITTYDENDKDLKQLTVNDDEWMFQNKADLAKFFIVGAGGPASVFLCEKNHSGHNWGLVIGFEKPEIVQIGNNWYSRQNDRLLNSLIGQPPNVESFYLSPLIHLKQSHLAKKAMKKLAISDGMRHRSIPEYRSWAKLIGRHDELVQGTSLNGKIVITNSIQFILNSDTKINELVNNNFLNIDMKTRLQKDDVVAKNYINGFYNLAGNKQFFEFLNKNFLTEPGKILSIKPTWSKHYNLGE